MEQGRFGPARLPEALHDAGLSSWALCPEGDLLSHSGFLKGLSVVPQTRAFAKLASALGMALAHSGARLILPSDEQAVILLHTLARGRGRSLISAAQREVIRASLGAPKGISASIFKSDTLALARDLGIAVPISRTVQSSDHAVQAADQIGYPVFHKESFSWAGRGVTRCDTSADVRRAFDACSARSSLVKRFGRRLLGRDWYPIQSAIDIQQGIDGEPMLFCGLGWQGRMIGGFAGRRLELEYPNGPSVAMHLSHEEGMAVVASKIITALGYTGFIGFDFMAPKSGCVPLLIECNPRLVPALHLGAWIGVDLCGALARLLAGEPLDEAPLVPDRELDVLLFPHALDPARAGGTRLVDLPHRDPGLIRSARRTLAQKAPRTDADPIAA